MAAGAECLARELGQAVPDAVPFIGARERDTRLDALLVGRGAGRFAGGTGLAIMVATAWERCEQPDVALAVLTITLIGGGAVVMADTEEHGAYIQRPAQRLDKKSDQIKL